MGFTLIPSVARRARDKFLCALEASVPAYELGQLQLFHEDDEAFISREVDRLLSEPCLPCAGDKERHMIAKLERMALEKDWEGRMGERGRGLISVPLVVALWRYFAPMPEEHLSDAHDPAFISKLARQEADDER